MCQKSNIDTTIDFVKTPNTQEITLSWKLFRKIIWNRRIITLAVRNDRTRRETQDKNVLLNFKTSEKIKQVSSTKLTNWYKNISRWKTNKILSPTYFFSRCEPKSLKNIAPEPQSIFSKHEKIVFQGEVRSPKHRDLAFLQKKET